MMDDMDEEFADDDPDDFGGMSEEEIAWFKHVREHMEPTPDLTERYVDPFTGEVLNEGGPDTPEVRALRAEAEELYRDRMRAEGEAKEAENSS